MNRFEWNQQYSVGNDLLDQQHDELFSILNQLNAHILKGQTQGLTWSLLDRLILYTQKHFHTEESLMRQSGYPQLEGHCKRHCQLTAQVQKYVAQLDRGEAIRNTDVLSFLSDWLRQHIAHEDKAFGNWLAAQSLLPERLACALIEQEG